MFFMFNKWMTGSSLQRPSMPLSGRRLSSPGRWPLSTRCTVWGSPKCLPNLSVPLSTAPRWRRWSWRPWSENPRNPTLRTGSALRYGFLTGRRWWCSSLAKDTTCRSTTWCWCRADGRRTCPASNSPWSEGNTTALTWWRRNSRGSDGRWCCWCKCLFVSV